MDFFAGIFPTLPIQRDELPVPATEELCGWQARLNINMNPSTSQCQKFYNNY